jgi:hypothetical protein
MPERRRFPPPGSIDESEACFIVRDHDKQALAYVYFGQCLSLIMAALEMVGEYSRAFARCGLILGSAEGSFPFCGAGAHKLGRLQH